jgi:hypothetical protein
LEKLENEKRGGVEDSSFALDGDLIRQMIKKENKMDEALIESSQKKPIFRT